MSGHITRMSRGSSVGSSCSRPTSTSRSTSTCRAEPWQACTCTESSRRGASGALVGARARGWPGGRAAASPSSVSGAAGAGAAGALGRSPSVRRSSRESRPSEPSRGWCTAAAEVSRERGTWPSRGGGAERVPEVGGGLRQPQVDVAQLAERGEEGHLGLRQPGVAEEREPRRAGRGRRRRSAAASSVSAWRTSGGGRVDAVDEPTPQLRLPAQVVVELAARPVGVAPLAPVGEQLRALDGVGGEQAGQPTRHGVAAGRPLVARVAAAEVAW